MGHAKGISDCAWTRDSEFIATASDDKARLFLSAGSLSVCRAVHASLALLVVSCDVKQHAQPDDLLSNFLGPPASPCSQCRSYWTLGAISFCNVSAPLRLQTLRLWEVATGDCVKEFVGHKKYVFCCNFSPHCNKLVRLAARSLLESTCHARLSKLHGPPTSLN